MIAVRQLTFPQAQLQLETREAELAQFAACLGEERARLEQQRTTFTTEVGAAQARYVACRDELGQQAQLLSAEQRRVQESARHTERLRTELAEAARTAEVQFASERRNLTEETENARRRVQDETQKLADERVHLHQAHKDLQSERQKLADESARLHQAQQLFQTDRRTLAEESDRVQLDRRKIAEEIAHHAAEKTKTGKFLEALEDRAATAETSERELRSGMSALRTTLVLNESEVQQRDEEIAKHTAGHEARLAQVKSERDYEDIHARKAMEDMEEKLMTVEVQRDEAKAREEEIRAAAEELRQSSVLSTKRCARARAGARAEFCIVHNRKVDM